MLFLLKRTAPASLLALLVLGAIGLLVRHFVPGPLPALTLTAEAVWTGLVVVGIVLASDGLLHGLLKLLFRERYRTRYHELASVFRAQSTPALLAGSLMAGVGEELLF